MDVLIHVANVLYLFSYLVRDILWLRCLTVVAALTLIAYFYAVGLWPPIVWNLAFIGINLAQVYRLLLERRPVKLDENEQRLYQMVFRALTPREFLKLARLATWKQAAPDDRLVEQGVELEEMMVLTSGGAAVSVNGAAVAELRPGSFVGEMSYLTGGTTSAAVTATEPTSYASWPAGELRRWLADHPELRAAWQFVLGADLATKLRAA